jgi:hypothetical protein
VAARDEQTTTRALMPAGTLSVNQIELSIDGYTISWIYLSCKLQSNLRPMWACHVESSLQAQDIKGVSLTTYWLPTLPVTDQFDFISFITFVKYRLIPNS